jgi:hypothetical protein
MPIQAEGAKLIFDPDDGQRSGWRYGDHTRDATDSALDEIAPAVADRAGAWREHNASFAEVEEVRGVSLDKLGLTSPGGAK